MRVAVFFVPFALVACGGAAPRALAVPSEVKLTPTGASPNLLLVSGNEQVKFINGDSADHQVVSGDCGELTSPKLAAGESFTATLGAGPKSCSYRDALNPSAAGFQGTVSVTQPSTGIDYGGG